jgi:hypothetical protein
MLKNEQKGKRKEGRNKTSTLFPKMALQKKGKCALLIKALSIHCIMHIKSNQIIYFLNP